MNLSKDVWINWALALTAIMSQVIWAAYALGPGNETKLPFWVNILSGGITGTSLIILMDRLTPKKRTWLKHIPVHYFVSFSSRPPSPGDECEECGRPYDSKVHEGRLT